MILASDLFALDINLTGFLNKWRLELLTSFSLDFARLSESSKANFSLKKSIDLNKSDKLQNSKLNLFPNKYNDYQNQFNIEIKTYLEEISWIFLEIQKFILVI